jgi:hypothetical protein
MKLKDCLGHWILWDISHFKNIKMDVDEAEDKMENLVKVVELGVDRMSPSGEYVRVFVGDDEDADASWFRVQDFEPYIFEILDKIEYESEFDESMKNVRLN